MKTNRIKKLAAVLLSGAMLSGIALMGADAATVSVDAQDTELVLEDGTYAPGEAIICFSGTGSESSEVSASNDIETETLMSTAGDSSGEVGASLDGSSSSGSTITLVSSDTLTTQELIELYEDRSDVLSAEPNYFVTTESVPTDPGYEWQWSESSAIYGDDDSAADMNVQSVWNTEADSSDVPVVAVVDTGVDYNHPDLKDVMWDDGLNYPELVALGGGKYGFNAADGGENTDDPIDTTVGHGTHCAGIIAAQWNNDEGVAGISDNAEIMALKIMGGSEGSLSYAVQCYNYLMTAKKAGVNLVAVNDSWGVTVYNGGIPYSVTLAMDMLGEECGVVSVVAAGNSNADNDLNTGSILQSPYIITVGASDSLGKKAPFSQYGKETVDVFAPGTAILSATTTYTSETVTMNSHEMIVQYLPQIQDADDSYFVEDFEDESSVLQMALVDESLNVADDNNTAADGVGGGSALSVALSDTNGETKDIMVKMTVDKSALSDIDTDNALYIAFMFRLCGNAADTKAKLYCADGETPIYANWNYSGENEQMRVGQYDSGWNQMSFEFVDPSVITTSVDEDGNFTFYLQLTGYSNVEGESASLRIDNLGFGKTASDYCYAGGTSMATPAVTGEAALLYSRYGYSCDELIARIKGGVINTDELESLCVSGGYVDVKKAVENPNPVVNDLAVTDDTAVIEGYFFGESGAAVTIDDTACEVLSQTDNEITILLPNGVSGHCLVTVTDASGAWGRDYFDINGDGVKGFTELTAPDLTFQSVSSGDLPDTDTQFIDAAAAGNTVLYTASTGSESFFAAYNTQTDEWAVLSPSETIISWVSNMTASKTKIYMTYVSMDLTNEELASYYAQYASDPEKLSEFMGEHTKYYLGIYDTNTGEISSMETDYKVYSGLLAVYKNQLISIGGKTSAESEVTSEISLVNPVTGRIIGSAGLPDITDAVASQLSISEGSAYLKAYVNGDSIIVTNTIAVSGYSIVYEFDGTQWSKNETEFYKDNGTFYEEKQTLHIGTVPVDGGLLVIGPAANLHEENMTDCWTYTVGGDFSANTDLKFSDTKTVRVVAAMLDGKVYCIGYNNSDRDNPFVFRCADVEYSGAPTKDPYILGDANEDGTVDIRDATEIQKHAAEIKTLTGSSFDAADVNGDGKVTVEDATEVQKYIAKIITNFG